MKNKKINILAILFAIISIFTFALGFQMTCKENVVFAVEEDEEAETITQDDNMLDAVLFKRLLSFYNDNLPDGKTKVKDLSTDMFADDHFAGMTLNLSGNDEEKIVFLTNIDLFDLSKFSQLDLSKNNIYSIVNLSQKTNFVSINLSDNWIVEFDSKDVNYLKLEYLDLSYNQISSCDLAEIKTIQKDDPNEQTTTVVDLQDNYLEVENLTVPTDENVLVKLSHNKLDKQKLLEKLDKQEMPANLQFGFQGVKRLDEYTVSQNAQFEFYQFDDVTQITIQKADTSAFSTEQVLQNSRKKYYELETELRELYQDVETLSAGNSYAFTEPGYYNIIFETNQAEKQGLKVDLCVFIKPNSPKLEMYKNGQKIDLQNKVSENVELKIANPEANETYFFKNIVTGETIIGDTLQIDTVGNNYYKAYKIVNGCLSAEQYISVFYQKSVAFGWIYILIGVAVFAVVGYVLYINIPKLVKLGIGKKGKNKHNKNLD